ncbi:hypothetical protein VTH82DRAFT_4148 [Thermothelomyces myriococcoides]
MSFHGWHAQGSTADIRSWLEAAITSSGAELPATSPSDAREAAGLGERSNDCHEAGEASMATPSPEFKPKISSAAATPSTNTTSYQRKLATVRRVASVTAINDTYQLLAIDGWKVLAKERKEDQFAAGEYVLFLEPDAFLPTGSEFEKLFSQVSEPICFEGEIGYRVGTWAICVGTEEVVSQGYVFHLSDFPEIDTKVGDLHWTNIEMSEQEFADMIREIDFSGDLGVRKWESSPESSDEAGPVIEGPTCYSRRNPDAENRINNTDLEAKEDTVCVRSNTKGKAKAQSDDANTATDNGGFPTSNPKPPSFIIKADMERAQNCPNLFIKPKYKHFIFQESVKLDGATMTVYFIRHDAGIDLPRLPSLNSTNEHTFLRYAVHPNGRLGVCSRNWDLLPHLLPREAGGTGKGRTAPVPPAHIHYWATAVAAGLHRILPSLNRNIAIQAELVGATIQGNPYNYPRTPGGPEHELFVFSITDITPTPRVATKSSSSAKGPLSTRMHPRKVETFCRQHGLPHVPVRGYHALHEIARGHETLMAWADLSRHEGLVYKNCHDGRWFKVLSTRWIRIKGDERRAREQQQQQQKEGTSLSKRGGRRKKKKKKKKKKNTQGADVASEPEDAEANRRPRCWLAPREVVEEILDIRDNLDEWVKKDEGVRQWVEWMNRDRHGQSDGDMFAKGRGDDGDGDGDGGPEENAWTKETNTNGNTKVENTGRDYDQNGINDRKVLVTNVPDEATACTGATTAETKNESTENDGERSRKTSGFGVSGAKRDRLVSWLGVGGFGL